MGSLTDRLFGSTPKLSPSRFTSTPSSTPAGDAEHAEQAGLAAGAARSLVDRTPAEIVLADGRGRHIDAQLGRVRSTKAVKVLEFGPGQTW